MKSQPRIFTLEEVNKIIPEIDRLIQHVMLKKEMYDRRHDEILMHELLTEAERSNAVDESTKALESDFLSLEEDLNDLEREMQKIMAHGCIIHDIETGCVDFLSKKDGELICYCWKIGEERVKFFHRYRSLHKDRLQLA